MAKAAAVAAKVAADFEGQEHGLGLSLGRTLRRLIESERVAAAAAKSAANGDGGDGGRALEGLAGLGEEGMRILRWHVANIEYSTGVRRASTLRNSIIVGNNLSEVYDLLQLFCVLCFAEVLFPLQSYWSLSCDHGLGFSDELNTKATTTAATTTTTTTTTTC